jgi:hypothetical protein
MGNGDLGTTMMIHIGDLHLIHVNFSTLQVPGPGLPELEMIILSYFSGVVCLLSYEREWLNE